VFVFGTAAAFYLWIDSTIFRDSLFPCF